MIKMKAKEVKAIIAATFPDYKKHDVYVGAAEKVTLHDLNWSGGSRSEYRACTIDGKPTENKYAAAMHVPAPWDNMFEGKTVDVPEGFVIVRGGYFCGKTATLFINVNPANMPKFITA